MVDVDKLSDAELRTKLLEFGFPVMPITGTTRKVMAKKLKLLLENKNKIGSDTAAGRRSLGRYSSEEESDTDAKQQVKKDKNRRATMAAPLMQPPASTTTTRGRRSNSRLNDSDAEVPAPSRASPKKEIKTTLVSTSRSTRILKNTSQDDFDTGSDSESDIVSSNVNFTRGSPLKSTSFSSSYSDAKYSPPKDNSFSRNLSSSTNRTTSSYVSPPLSGSNASEYASERLNQIRSRLSLNNSTYDRPLSYTSSYSSTTAAADKIDPEETPFLSNFTKRLSTLTVPKKDLDFKSDIIKEYDTNGSSYSTSVRSQLSNFRATKGRDATYDYRANQNSILKNNFVSFAVLAGAALFFIFLAIMYLGMRSDTSVVPSDYKVPLCFKADVVNPKKGVNCLDEHNVSDAINLLNVIRPELNKRAVANVCYDSTIKPHMSEQEIVHYCTTNFAIKDELKVLQDLRNVQILSYSNPQWGIKVAQTGNSASTVTDSDLVPNMEQVVFNRDQKITNLVIMQPDIPWKCSMANTAQFLLQSCLFLGVVFGILYVASLGYKYYKHYVLKEKEEVGFMVERIIDILQSNDEKDGFVVINHVRDMILPVADRKNLLTEDCEVLKRQFLADLMNDDPLEVERKTVDQSSSELWLKMRQKRLTASNFGRICKMRPTTDPRNTVQSLVHNKFHGNEATKYGAHFEAQAVAQFEQQTGLTVEKCGLFIDREKPFLAASPDGLVPQKNALVEVKCPFSAKNLTVLEAVKKGLLRYLKLSNNGLKLDQNSNYYHQIQGQLNITGLPICYFIVWTNRDLWFEVVQRDEVFWGKQLVKLEQFYMQHMLPELIKLHYFNI